MFSKENPLKKILNWKKNNISDIEYDKICILFLKKLSLILDEETKNEVRDTFDKLPQSLWIHWKVERMYPYILKWLWQDKLDNVLKMVKNDISEIGFTKEISKNSINYKKKIYSFIVTFIKEFFKTNEVDFSWTKNKRILTKEEKEILSTYNNIKTWFFLKTDYIIFVYILISLAIILLIVLNLK